MIAPPLPLDEAERLADLRSLHLLDTPPEKRFDRIVGLCANVFHVPIAYIALVDAERQWFKAKCGLKVDSTGRDQSFCGHTIRRDEPLIIPDARRDPRFHDNPLVTHEPFIRFYAGYPLAGPHGHNVGTLCLASPEPRYLNTSEMGLFEQFASLAARELNLVDIIEAQHQLLETQNRLLETQEKLRRELTEAAEFVRSLLPQPLDGPVRAQWEFVSSSQLGGDFLGYHWLDPNQLAFYLFDVSGHGVGASLLSVSVYNAIRRQTLPHTNFGDPADVLTALNRAFPMSENDHKFFTIWYGVLNVRKGELRYSSAGHPPAVAFVPGSQGPLELGQPSLIAGLDQNWTYENQVQPLPHGARLFLFSDGVFEVRKPDGSMLNYEGLVQLLSDSANLNGQAVRSLVQRIQQIHGSPQFDDDFSILKLEIA